MDIWIIRNGEKAGPIPDYEIRRKIEGGDIGPETPAWHDGLAAWLPVSEIELFKKEFDLKPSTIPQPAIEAGPKPPPLPERQVFGRRFWARWFDIHFFLAFWWLAMWAVGRDIEAAFQNPWIILLQLIPWFIIESILLHRIGTTPGKWLLGILVRNVDGSYPSVLAATQRSLRVMIVGIGFGWSILSILCQAMSFFTARKIGNTLWDHLGGHRVQARPLVPWRVAALVVMFIIAVQLQMAVISPYLYQSVVKAFPELKEQVEKNPPWAFPKRHR